MASASNLEISEVVVPTELIQNTLGCAFDIGGSRCKAAYRKKKQYPDITGKCRLGLITVNRDCVESAFQHVLEHADLTPDKAGGVMYTTGVSSRGAIKDILEKTFGLRVENLSEHKCLMAGMEMMVRCQPKEEVAVPPPEQIVTGLKMMEDTVSRLREAMSGTLVKQKKPKQKREWKPPRPGDNSYASKDPALYPYMLTSVGSGCSYNVVGKNGTKHAPTGTLIAGKTLQGLGQLLVGTKDYDELLELACKGDDSTVSNYMRDLKQGCTNKNSYYELFPDDILVFCFGRVADGLADKPKKEDLARALISMMCSVLGQNAYWVARGLGCSRIFLTGGFFDHPLIRDMISMFSMGEAQLCGRNGEKMQINFVKNGSYLGAIGALMFSAGHEYFPVGFHAKL